MIIFQPEQPSGGGRARRFEQKPWTAASADWVGDMGGFAVQQQQQQQRQQQQQQEARPLANRACPDPWSDPSGGGGGLFNFPGAEAGILSRSASPMVGANPWTACAMGGQQQPPRPQQPAGAAPRLLSEQRDPFGRPPPQADSLGFQPPMENPGVHRVSA